MNTRPYDDSLYTPYNHYGYDPYQSYQPLYVQQQYAPVYLSPEYPLVYIPQQVISPCVLMTTPMLESYQQQMNYLYLCQMQAAQVQAAQAPVAQTTNIQPKPLTFWQHHKQKKKEQQTVKKQVNEFLKKFEPNNSNNEIKESLSEKILKSKYLQEKIQESGRNSRIANQPHNKNDYSQDSILRKISSFLNYIGEQKIPTGHCHGISLAWLSFMYLGLEKIFYQMIKTIAECPTNQLHTISDVILTFFDLIDVGQNPGRYSNNAYTQEDVGKIIGDVGEFKFVEKEINSIFEIHKLVNDYSKDKTMIVVSGIETDKGVKHSGHSIGLFKRGNQYHIFDSNYNDGIDKVFYTSDAATVEIDECLASITQARNRNKVLIELYVVREPKLLSKLLAAKNDITISGSPTLWKKGRNAKFKYVGIPEYTNNKRYII
jgi:hypothetical protein